MRLLQSKYIPSSDPWEPNFCGKFVSIKKVPCFLYKDRQTVCMLLLTSDMPTVLSLETGKNLLPLPSKWVVLEHDGQPFLMPTPNYAIDLQQEKQLLSVPGFLQADYLVHAKPEMYFETHSFVFGEYCISHKGSCGYICRKADKDIWTFAGKAYLYTDIGRWKNRIFFGTAGFGGYFYILDIDTGAPVVSIKTGGTASIVQNNNLCFIASNGKKCNSSNLLCVDMNEGKIIQELDLYGSVNEDSKLQMIDQQLHMVTFEYRGKRLQNAIWNVVSI